MSALAPERRRSPGRKAGAAAGPGRRYTRGRVQACQADEPPAAPMHQGRSRRAEAAAAAAAPPLCLCLCWSPCVRSHRYVMPRLLSSSTFSLFLKPWPAEATCAAVSGSCAAAAAAGCWRLGACCPCALRAALLLPASAASAALRFAMLLCGLLLRSPWSQSGADFAMVAMIMLVACMHVLLCRQGSGSSHSSAAQPCRLLASAAFNVRSACSTAITNQHGWTG